MRRRGVTGGLLLVMALAVGVVATAAPPPAADAAPSDELLPLHAVRGPGAGIYDSAGRQVLLRAVNVNALGDYYQANPAYPTVLPFTDADLDEMAGYGFNAMRLLVSWSRLEPTRGVYDDAYIAQIRDLVQRAQARGIYSVVDMHQDAYGKFVASPPGVVCGPGLEPAIGWDGAPEWATYTDGADTCRPPGDRDGAEAVKTAWDNFYADRDGIQGNLVATWRVLANALAREPGVAGYDLLNEPGVGHDGVATAVALGQFYDRAIASIRAGEADAVGPGHDVAWYRPAFFETNVNGGAVPTDFTADQGIVLSPHNYGESIVPLSIEILDSYFSSLAASYGTTTWGGEYGWFGDPAANLEKLTRYARLEDSRGSSSAWWQWVQACGDPHSVNVPGGTPDPVLIHFHRNTCPGDGVEVPAIAEWRQVLSRPFPRATPGRLLSLASDGATRSLRVVGEVDPAVAASGGAAATLDLWVPDGAGPPAVEGTGLADVTVTPVPGGYRVEAQVCGRYEATLGSLPTEATSSTTLPPPSVDQSGCTAPPPTSASTTRPGGSGGRGGQGAVAVSVTPRFTG